MESLNHTIAGIWRSSELNSAHYFCNTNAHSIDRLHVSIGISKIKEEEDQFVNEMVHSVIIRIYTAQNMTRQLECAPMEMSK